MRAATTGFRFTFISSNHTWGGSEELWSATAAVLASQGHQVAVLQAFLDRHQPRVRTLRSLSVGLHDLVPLAWRPATLGGRGGKLWLHLFATQSLPRLRWHLSRVRPHLVVLSQGGNADGLHLGSACRQLGVPYVLIAQKADHMYWPTDAQRVALRGLYLNATASFFVSEHNLRLTAEQIGCTIPYASVVRNPFLVPYARRTDWPDEHDGMRLACVARLYPMEKGQDLLLRVLARDVWRARPLSVAFYGKGEYGRGLAEMASYLGLGSVSFPGWVDDPSSIWTDHHGLIMPSRCEGLPLALVEAMLSGRVPIATDVAGHREVVDDERTGFLAAAATEEALHEAMERAWVRRADWRLIGAAAADQIRTLVPPDPGRSLSETLLRVATDLAEPEHLHAQAFARPTPATGDHP